MIHVGRNTRSRIVSKGISAGRSENSYRGLVRVAKAAEEMTYAPKFDYVLVNDNLQTAFAESEKVVEDFLDDGKLNYSTIV